jgi:NAD(P) transhydrogenase
MGAGRRSVRGVLALDRQVDRLDRPASQARERPTSGHEFGSGSRRCPRSTPSLSEPREPTQLMYDYDLICIGSGPAGQRAAVQAAKLGKRACVVERRFQYGGVCTETGTIPSKTFREAVKGFRAYQRLAKTHSPATSTRPEMSDLLGRVAEVIGKEAEVVRDQLARNEVDLINGTARFVDEHTVEIWTGSGTRRVTFENAMIAVGTRPVEPKGVPVDGQTILTSDDIISLEKLPRTMVVVGSGVIGVEYASMFAQLGVQVTVVDKRVRPLDFLDHEITDDLVHQMRRNYVTFRGGEGVESIDIVEMPQKKGVVRLDSGKFLVADVVLFSAGRQGATDRLGLDSIGVEPTKRGLLEVDAHYRTACPNVYAAGDVIGYPALAATSAEQGRLSACHMFDQSTESMPEHYPVGIYSIPEISMVGPTEQELTEKKIPYETGIARYREIARGQILGDDSGLFKMIFRRDDKRLLAVHCIGTGATELVHVGQAVLALGGGLDYFLSTVFNYPTLAECYKVAAYNAANKLRLAEIFEQREHVKVDVTSEDEPVRDVA